MFGLGILEFWIRALGSTVSGSGSGWFGFRDSGVWIWCFSALVKETLQAPL